MDNPKLWFMTAESNAFWAFCQALLRDSTLGTLNSKEFKSAEYALGLRYRNVSSRDVPLPEDFPVLRLAMPRKVAPEFFWYDGFTFVSRRLKEAMAQPGEVVQFVPVDLVRGGPQARAHGYHLMRVLARQPAIDLARSECEVEERMNRVTGRRFKVLRNVRQLALLDDLQPRTEVFRPDELPARVLVSDAVAERVLRAGCTGVEFADPANREGGMRVDCYRTVDGVAERKVGFLE